MKQLLWVLLGCPGRYPHPVGCDPSGRLGTTERMDASRSDCVRETQSLNKTLAAANGLSLHRTHVLDLVAI
jgi:hypothetical protein